MPYRENGLLKTSYRDDQRVFAIAQTGSESGCWPSRRSACLLVRTTTFRAILIPFDLALMAALGLNILVGYCGQISLGTGAFMAVGAYAATWPLRAHRACRALSRSSRRRVHDAGGHVFGIRRCASKGLYLAVAHPRRRRFFWDWAFLRVKWFTNNSSSGSVSVADLSVFGCRSPRRARSTLFCLAMRSSSRDRGQEPGAQPHRPRVDGDRDMDVAAALIGIRLVHAKLSAFAVSSFIVARRARCGASSHLGSTGTGGVLDRPLVPPLHDHHRSPGLDQRDAAFIVVPPIFLNQFRRGSAACSASTSAVAVSHAELMVFGALIDNSSSSSSRTAWRLWSIGKEPLGWPFPH